MILRQHNQFLLSRPPAAEPPLVLLELVENEEGGQISIHGLLAHVWAAGDEGYRRYRWDHRADQ